VPDDGERESSIAASTGPPNSAPSLVTLPPIAFGISHRSVVIAR
jgi:hypothetical protein